MTPDGSRYTEKETAAIIKRALELQQERSGEAVPGALHLEEIQRVGAEVIGGVGLGAGLGVGLGVGIAVLGSPLFCVAVPVGALALSWLLARSLYRRVARGAASRARRSVAALARALAPGP